VTYNTFGPILTSHTGKRICGHIRYGTVPVASELMYLQSTHRGSRHSQHTFTPHVSVWSLPTWSRYKELSSHAEGAIRSDTKQSGCSIFRGIHMKALSDGRGYKQRPSRCLHSSHLFISVSKTPIQWLFPTTCPTNFLPHIWYTARLNTLCSLEWIKLRWSACDDIYCITEIRSMSVSISKSTH
jgi:hypothetical protein